MRLLVCNSCRTIDPLPDYDGPAEDDRTLTFATESHRDASGEPHRGHLVNVKDKDWENPRIRHDIIEQLNSKTHTGLESSFYVTKANSMEDAMACFRRHRRPADSCEDYLSESKRMKPDTAADRKELGLGKRKVDPRKEVYLCHFCPVHSKVVERWRIAKGAYK
jgi:hypothetical protein